MIYVLLTSQSLLPTEAVEAQRTIKGLAPATKTKPIHLRPQRDRMQATYSNPKPAHKNSRKKRLCTGATLSLLKCATSKLFWKGTQHLWRQVILHGLVSCCGRIVSSFTLSLFPCRNWHCFIVLLGWTVVMWQVRDGTSRWSLVGAGGQ